MKEGTEDDAPSEPRDAERWVEEQDAGDDADIIKDGTHGIDEESPLKLCHAREQVRYSEEQRLEEHDAHEEHDRGMLGGFEAGKQEQRQAGRQHECCSAEKEDKEKKDGEYRIEESARALFPLRHAPREERDEDGQRNHRRAPDEDEIRYPEGRIVHVEYFPRSEVRGEEPVAEESEYLRQEREYTQKISGLMEPAYLPL